MRAAFRFLARCLGINRPKPRTRIGRYWRRSEHCLIVFLVAYVGLHLFPQVLFALYSRQPLPPEAAHSLREAAALVGECELAGELGDEKIFVCGSAGLFRVFNPRGVSAFGISVPVTDHVFLAAPDFDTNTIQHFGDEYNSRALPAVIAHEIAHGLIRRRLGLLREKQLPKWLKEGYCEHVAREGSFPDDEGWRLFVSGESHPSASYRYYTYRLLVTNLLEEEDRSFEELAREPRRFEEVAASFRRSVMDAR